MELNDFLKMIEYKITDGSKYQWDCFGPNARYIDYYDESLGVSASVAFDTVTQTVYEATIIDEVADRPYRWMNPDFKEVYYAEAKIRKCDPDQAWDDVKYINLEVEKDYFEKGKAILNGERYDDRVVIPLDFEDTVLFVLMKQAHAADITLNQHLENILQRACDNALGGQENE